MSLVKLFKDLLASRNEQLAIPTPALPIPSLYEGTELTPAEANYWDTARYFKKYIAARTQARMGELLYEREKTYSAELEAKIEEQLKIIKTLSLGTTDRDKLLRQIAHLENTVSQLRHQVEKERQHKQHYRLQLDACSGRKLL